MRGHCSAHSTESRAMQLTLWTYEGPTHVGAMRVATAMHGLHYVLHAPQGDTYADLLFTMIDARRSSAGHLYDISGARPWRRYGATFQDRRPDAFERFAPQAMLVGASCTAELIQDDPGCPVKALEYTDSGHCDWSSRHIRRRKTWAGGDLLSNGSHICAGTTIAQTSAGAKPRCNLLGPTALGFRHRDDIREITRPARTSGRRRYRWWRHWARPSGYRRYWRGGLQRRSLPRDRIEGSEMAGKDSMGNPFAK